MIDPGTQAQGIVTPEGVVLAFEEAGLGSRSLAFLLDLLIRVVVLLGILIGVAMAGGVSEVALIITVTISIFVLLLVYPVVFEVAVRGRTPGKMALGLRVITVEGGPVRLRHAVVRSGLGLVDFVVTAGVAAVVVSLVGRRSQRLGDIVAGTMVVRERVATKGADAITFTPPWGWEPFTAGLDVSHLGGDVAVLIRGFLLRADSLGADARWRLAHQLASGVAGRLGIALPAHTYPEAFLVAVSAAHQRADARVALAADPAAWTMPGSAGHLPVLGADDLSATWGQPA